MSSKPGHHYNYNYDDGYDNNDNKRNKKIYDYEFEEEYDNYRREENPGKRDDFYDEYEALANVKRTSSLSAAALCAGIMSVITVFGGYTAVLGVVFAFIGLLAGKRGVRSNPTAAARWAVRISVIGLLLCSFVTLLFVCFYVFGNISDGSAGASLREHLSSFDLHGIYDRMKELMISVIDRL